jgi:hypothetical protein
MPNHFIQRDLLELGVSTIDSTGHPMASWSRSLSLSTIWGELSAYERLEDEARRFITFLISPIIYLYVSNSLKFFYIIGY